MGINNLDIIWIYNQQYDILTFCWACLKRLKTGYTPSMGPLTFLEKNIVDQRQYYMIIQITILRAKSSNIMIYHHQSHL